LAIAVPTTIAGALLVTPSLAQNAPPKDPPAAAKDKKDDAKDAAKDAKNDAKDVKDSAKDAAKDAKDTSKDAAKDVKDTTKDTARDAKDAAKNAKDDVKDTARDARENVRDARDDVRDTRKDARDDVRDTRDAARDKVRDPRDPKDPNRDQSRDARDPENVKRPDRNDARDDRRDDRPAARDDNDRGIGANVKFSAQGTRAADIGLWFDRDNSKGLVISDVASQGAIARLGFREGDRIVSVNGQKVTRENDFITYLFADDVRNERIKVIVIRDGREEVIMVEPAVFVEELSYVQNDPLETFGIVVDDRYNDRIVVWRVIPRSPAYYAGIRTGDVIVGFNGQRLANIATFVQRLSNATAGEVPVQVTRGQADRTLHVDVPKFVNRSERRTSLRPNFDNAAERREDRLDRREERIEDRRDRRDNVAPRTNTPAPGVAPVPAPVAPANPPAVTPAPRPNTPAPAPGNPPARPGLFPRNK
jgi:hypothetical protein